uniref:Atg6 BARA domain-containing protein n=1 Tax=Timema douglasi TaxID=61478 RepID=A0A7R8VSS7_TIMDO|nr:unnamed protein product [Timema douglasi]
MADTSSQGVKRNYPHLCYVLPHLQINEHHSASVPHYLAFLSWPTPAARESNGTTLTSVMSFPICKSTSTTQLCAALPCLPVMADTSSQGVKRNYPHLCYVLPHLQINEHHSALIQFNSEEQWTKALKFLLTNLKWGLAWVSSQFTKDNTDSLNR